MRIILSKISIIILIPILIYSIYMVFHLGMADVYSSSSINKIDKQLKGKTSIDAEQWKKIERSLQVVIKFDPLNPNIHEHYGYAVEGSYKKS